MCRFSHPDTLTIAAAQHRAYIAGHAPGSLDYLKAYRHAYQDAAAGSFPESLALYLEVLDRQVARMEQGLDLACLPAGVLPPRPQVLRGSYGATIGQAANSQLQSGSLMPKGGDTWTLNTVLGRAVRRIHDVTSALRGQWKQTA